MTPLELTNKLMEAAIEKGAKLLYGVVDGIEITDGKVAGVKIAGTTVIFRMSCSTNWIMFMISWH